MKIFLLSTLSLSVLAFIPASLQAAPYEGSLKAEMQAVQSDNFLNGSVQIDARDKRVELTLQPVMPECKEGFMCIQVMPEPVSYTLEAAKIKRDRCGVIQTKANMDQRPVDGIFLEVTIRDNRAMTCPTLVAVAPVEILVRQKYHDRLQRKEIEMKDRFEAQELVPVEPVKVLFAGKILKSHYSPKALELELEYSGGCMEHEFRLEWGECNSVDILHTTLKECKVELIHSKGSEDLCKMLVTKTHKIDLSHLGAAYILNLNGEQILVH